ncbi:MAG: hypothetical protein KF908_15470, partial [Nitrosomonas sp.]|nr:hypothetical protein [Nitrosomonas sp.]
MVWLREQQSVPTFTKPSKRIAVLSLAGLGDMLSPPAPNHAQSSGRLITSQGSVPATPNNPMTNRTPIGCRERFVAQPRPLFRQWMTTKETSLDAVQNFTVK